MLRNLTIAILVYLPILINAQVEVTTGNTPEELAQEIIGNGIDFSNASVYGTDEMYGMFYNAENTILDMNTGVYLTSGSGLDIPGPATNNASNSNGLPGHELLTVLSGQDTHDASIMEFDFVPSGNEIQINYRFGSDEYNTWGFEGWNDICGIFVSGPKPGGGVYADTNIAVVPDSLPPIPVCVININNGPENNGPCMNCEYYVDNTDGLYLTYNGFTIVLTATLDVIPNEGYHIQLVVADANDGVVDTGVFFESQSMTSPTGLYLDVVYEYEEMVVEGCKNAEIVFTLADVNLAPVSIPFTLSGSVDLDDYEPLPDSIYFGDGEDTVIFPIVPIYDSLPEGEENFVLTTETNFNGQTMNQSVEILFINYEELAVGVIEEYMICEGEEVEITIMPELGLPPYSFAWAGLPDTTAMITVSPDETTSYTVTITDACGNSIQEELNVIVYPIPEVYLGEDISAEQGTQVILDAGVGFVSYLWSTNETTQTIMVTETNTYWVQVTDINGCNATEDIEVDFYVGIKDNKPKEIIHIAPNPTQNTFTIQSSYNGTARLYSLPGSVISKKTINQGESKIWDISDLDNGVYFIQFISKDKNSIIKKIIKR